MAHHRCQSKRLRPCIVRIYTATTHTSHHSNLAPLRRVLVRKCARVFTEHRYGSITESIASSPPPAHPVPSSSVCAMLWLATERTPLNRSRSCAVDCNAIKCRTRRRSRRRGQGGLDAECQASQATLALSRDERTHCRDTDLTPHSLKGPRSWAVSQQQATLFVCDDCQQAVTSRPARI